MSHRTCSHRAALGAILCFPLLALADDPCINDWTSGLFCPRTTTTGWVYDTLAWDDGSGEALYVAGSFSTGSATGCNENVARVARRVGETWQGLVGPNGIGLNAPARALAVYDDGTGQALYAGGEFLQAAGQTVNRVARWDGTTWQPLTGPMGTGVDGIVLAMTAFDDGTGPALYVGGGFATSGGKPIPHLARWDGTDWTSVNNPGRAGLDGWVYALTTHDDGTSTRLYAGGAFLFAGNLRVNNVASWNGSTWSRLGVQGASGVDATVEAFASFDDGTGPALYVGGRFSHAADMPAGRIARWSGNAWQTVGAPAGTGFDLRITALAVADVDGSPALYAGGEFSNIDGVAATRVARWDGTAWSPLLDMPPHGIQGTVLSLTGVSEDGTEALYLGGTFQGPQPFTTFGLARWDGDTFFEIPGAPSTSPDDSVSTMTIFDDGHGPALFAGGSFLTTAGITVNRVARWDGSTWSPLPTEDGVGFTGSVIAMTTFDDGSGERLFIGAANRPTGSPISTSIATWDGTRLEPLVAPSGIINDLYVSHIGEQPDLYAGGQFATFEGITFNNIARWDGQTWHPLAGPSGVGVSVAALAMTDYDDGTGLALYVGGVFSQAGGQPASHIARWDGSNWTPLGIGLTDRARALVVFDGRDGRGPGLYVSGTFVRAGGVAVWNIARWDANGWSAVTPFGNVGGNLGVNALAVFDQGDGEALYAAGSFGGLGTTVVRNIARLSGDTWTTLRGPTGNDGTSGAISCLASTTLDPLGSPALYAGGSISTAGSFASHRIARWQGCPPACPPDLDKNGTLDFADILIFVDRFSDADPRADWNTDGLIDIFDLIAYVGDLDAGCP